MKKKVIGLCCAVSLLLGGCSMDGTAKILAYVIQNQLDELYWWNSAEEPTNNPENFIEPDTTSAEPEGVPESAYAEISERLSEGNYQQAYARAEEWLVTFPSDSRLEQMRQAIYEQWKAETFSAAQTAFGDNFDYEAAIRVLQASGLLGEEVDAEIARYQEYAPVPLKSFTPTKQAENIHVGTWDSSEYTDVNGNIYDADSVIIPYKLQGFQSEEDSYVTFYLYGSYRIFDAVLYRTYSSLSAPDAAWERETLVKIYGDDVLLYEGPGIAKDTYEQYSIHIDITGVRELRIVLIGIWRSGSVGTNPLIGVANATVQK